MYLSNIKLWNYRKFGSTVFSLSKPNLNLEFTKGLNVIIGENDSGKTAIVDAIKLVLKTHSYDYIRVEDEDFFKDSLRFRIELKFSELLEEEAAHFTEWLGWDKDDDGKVTPYLKLMYDVSRTKERVLPTDVRAGTDDEGYPLTAEAKDYLKATYLKPLRDAKNELVAKRNSRLAQVLLGDVAFKGKDNNHELLDLFKQLNSSMTEYFEGNLQINNPVTSNPTVPQDGKNIKNKIDNYIQKFYGNNAETEFSASENTLKSILEKLTLGLKDEINLGLGTLNRLFMATELLHLNKQNWTGLRLGLIEELEAHLHPQAQMQVVEYLQKQDDIQLILTSHSPNLVSKLKLQNLIVCQGGNAFPMGNKHTKLNEENYKFLEKFLDTTKANLFFAKGVIFVEGWSEEILLPSLAKLIDIDLTKEGISIVNIGNTGFEHYARIYIREIEPYMTMPVAVVTDPDIRIYKKVGDNFIKRNEQEVETETLTKISEIKNNDEHNIKYFPAPLWTLEYSLLESTTLKEQFKQALEDSHTGTSWENRHEKELSKKLINKGLNKTDIACRLAKAIDEDLDKDESEREIGLDQDDIYIGYLLEAIRYVVGVSNNVDNR